MRDFIEYLRAYRSYVSTSLGWAKALLGASIWLAGMFAPLAAKTFALIHPPAWFMVTWMLAWAAAGYVLTPYGMWKHYRAQLRA